MVFIQLESHMEKIFEPIEILHVTKFATRHLVYLFVSHIFLIF